ncbi:MULTISPECIES: fumarylacetoacetate hydrolase family protein [unclassified Leeuwenhoekiella]|uniref:fumarylacetoacetate hydrolase family protein n=1 Tax=unclassified Leeuwenhoekiella TaxID=2615029 RepID=UPI000C4673D0|nr:MULTISPECIES: fumarylacetoacetate hydrolase family protein [unclassified Leeuwenhoekiella]MAW94833.1 2-hydroxyhepta-2,4-diene-1,7-dioate isomerase [Leeuwenhoekiella sp.]MBA79553.1 2-hydroxyhepta-2,4-diene-1,7-dioate isomerase [Leeuwenhoekiella sp.]|tara:strand:- start:1661 stop:2272 length:612 start_codon:yes stop_codon:yes gene_type:complete
MKIICIGQNYNEHVKELNSKPTGEPLFFLKPDSAVLLSNHPFVIPEFTNEVHYEVEVLIRINRLGKYIAPKFAHKYYDEIGLGIDFTARDIQRSCKEKGHPWEKAKGFDGSAVIGSWMSKEKFKDLRNINFHLKKNDEIVQQGNTGDMIYDIATLIAHVSQFMTLKIGDVLFTGTPAGVGPVDINDRLTGFLEDQELFSVNIK